MLYFITGNKNKFAEIQAMLPAVQHLEVDLPEVQDVDAHKIIAAKLQEARKHNDGALMIEDTSLYFDCLNGLPGPLIKWFMETIGNDGLAQIAHKLGNAKAQAKTIIGYSTADQHLYYFEGIVEGSIVAPRGATHFGWDPIFQPNNSQKTFAEMSAQEKNATSMRRRAAEKLKEFLNTEQTHGEE